MKSILGDQLLFVFLVHKVFQLANYLRVQINIVVVVHSGLCYLRGKHPHEHSLVRIIARWCEYFLILANVGALGIADNRAVCDSLARKEFKYGFSVYNWQNV